MLAMSASAPACLSGWCGLWRNFTCISGANLENPKSAYEQQVGARRGGVKSGANAGDQVERVRQSYPKSHYQKINIIKKSLTTESALAHLLPSLHNHSSGVPETNQL